MTATTTRRPAPSDDEAGSEWVVRLARFGLVGKGVVHAVVGLLALELALRGSSSSEASTTGAADWLADRPFGIPALWVMAASLLALTLWRGITTFTGDPVEDDDGWYRAVWAAKALAYGALAATFATATLRGGTGGQSQDDQAAETTSTVFDLPMGRWIVVAAGVATIGVALHLVFVHTLGVQFARRLSSRRDSPAITLGRVGYGLRSLAYVVVGGFLVEAGLSGDDQRADGLSGALDRAGDAAWGTALLLGVAVGFLAYGAYCFAEARLRRSA